MDTGLLSQIIAYILPSIVTGAVAYYLFVMHFRNEENRRKYLINREYTKATLPLRLQAYERMILFLERISPGMLLTRVQANTEDHRRYLEILAQHVDMEFEHNLSQQIYISDKAWSMVIAAKNATLQLLRNTAEKEDIHNTGEFREAIIRLGLKETFPSHTAIVFLKSEVAELF